LNTPRRYPAPEMRENFSEHPPKNKFRPALGFGARADPSLDSCAHG